MPTFYLCIWKELNIKTTHTARWSIHTCPTSESACWFYTHTTLSCPIYKNKPPKMSRDTHRLWPKGWLFTIFLVVIVSFTLWARQSAPTTSSAVVVDADMSHLEALPYMCCIDISPLRFFFFFPRRPDCEAPVMMWIKATWDLYITALDTFLSLLLQKHFPFTKVKNRGRSNASKLLQDPESLTPYLVWEKWNLLTRRYFVAYMIAFKLWL